MTALDPRRDPSHDAAAMVVRELHVIAVDEAYRMVAMYLDRLQELGEDPMAMSTEDSSGGHVSIIRGWSRELRHFAEDAAQWEQHLIAPEDRDRDDPTGLFPWIDELRHAVERKNRT